MWDPDRYLDFEQHRRRPVDDLLARITTDPVRRIVDLGCGPGQLTDRLAERWPGAAITAVDRDPAMLERARTRPSAARVDYVEADIGEWQPATSVDLVFSNAALHWLPHHMDLLETYLHWLSPGGTLAVQIPGNTDAASHRVVAELRRSERWAAAVGEGADDHVAVAEPADYARRLGALRAEVDVWESTYLHLLAGSDPVVTWLTGSTLRPVLAALTPADQAAFVTELTDRLRPHYPTDATGQTVFAFRRIFLVARRPTRPVRTDDSRECVPPA